MKYESVFRCESETNPGVTFAIHKPSYGRKIEFDLDTSDFREQSRNLRRKHEALREELRHMRAAWDIANRTQLVQLRKELANATDAEIKAGIERSIAAIEKYYDLERLQNQLLNAKGDEEADALTKQLVAFDTDDMIAPFSNPPETIEELNLINEEATRLMARIYNPARVRWGLAEIDGIEINGEPATVDSLIKAGPEDLFVEILNKIDSVSGLTSDQLKNSSLPTISSGQVDGSENNMIATDAGTTGFTEPAIAGNPKRRNSTRPIASIPPQAAPANDGRRNIKPVPDSTS